MRIFNQALLTQINLNYLLLLICLQTPNTWCERERQRESQALKTYAM